MSAADRLMKAVVRSEYGDADVLWIARLARPVPKNDEVLIRVKAAGLDYGQWHLMAGKPLAMRLATGLTQPKQHMLGMDVSGCRCSHLRVTVTEDASPMPTLRRSPDQ